MRIAIDVGHGMHNRYVNRYDPGAEVPGPGDEHTYMEGMGDRLRRDLMELGHKVLFLHDMPLTARDDQAKVWGADLLVSLHLNAGGGQGTEVWVNTPLDYRAGKTAREIRNRMENLGFRDRGTKYTNAFAVLRANRHDCLVEVCFADSKLDMERYRRHNANDVELALLNGILRGLGLRSVSKLPRF